MPEAPDLEVIKEFLDANVLGRSVASISVLKPTVVRSLVDDLARDMPGRSFPGTAGWSSTPCSPERYSIVKATRGR